MVLASSIIAENDAQAIETCPVCDTPVRVEAMLRAPPPNWFAVGTCPLAATVGQLGSPR
jgi:hypothetical protein